jgi:hypothetical protein
MMNSMLRTVDFIFRRMAIVFICLFGLGMAPVSEDIVPAPEADPHYTQVGFFDIHVCNWPDQPLFFLTLFSTYDYDAVAKVEIFTPDNQFIGDLDLTKYRLIRETGKPEKRAFIKHFEVPQGARDGWYKAIVTTKDGKRYAAEDFLVIRKMQRAQHTQPADGVENVPIPKQLSWDSVPGAKYYKVFIRDEWKGDLVYESELLAEPRLMLPKNIVHAGGYYHWRIHARDVGENMLLGDFNHGSLTDAFSFSVTAD